MPFNVHVKNVPLNGHDLYCICPVSQLTRNHAPIRTGGMKVHYVRHSLESKWIGIEWAYTYSWPQSVAATIVKGQRRKQGKQALWVASIRLSCSSKGETYALCKVLIVWILRHWQQCLQVKRCCLNKGTRRQTEAAERLVNTSDTTNDTRSGHRRSIHMIKSSVLGSTLSYLSANTIYLLQSLHDNFNSLHSVMSSDSKFAAALASARAETAVVCMHYSTSSQTTWRVLRGEENFFLTIIWWLI